MKEEPKLSKVECHQDVYVCSFLQEQMQGNRVNKWEKKTKSKKSWSKEMNTVEHFGSSARDMRKKSSLTESSREMSSWLLTSRAKFMMNPGMSSGLTRSWSGFVGWLCSKRSTFEASRPVWANSKQWRANERTSKEMNEILKQRWSFLIEVVWAMQYCVKKVSSLQYF